jgi:hypothetical protein
MATLRFTTCGLLLCMVISTCKETKSDISVSIKAKSAEGFPVAGAIVSLDEQQLGQTNGFGTLDTTIRVNAGDRHKITITKDDDKYYFAPHVETFTSEPGEQKSLKVDAMMYTVPKPKINKKNVQSAETLGESNQNETKIESLALSQAVPLPLLEITKLLDSKSSDLKTVTAAPSAIFTVHVYSGRFPLNDVRVSFTNQNGLSAKCVSNDRGRCVLEVQASLPGEGTLTAQKTGYQTTSTTLAVKENDNHRLNMTQGSSLDARISLASPFETKPAAGFYVKIRNQNRNAVTSDSAGFVSIPVDSKFPFEVDITHASTGTSVRRKVQDAKDLDLNVTVSDGSTEGWTKLFRYPIHLSHDVSKESGLLDFELLDSALQNKFKNEILTESVRSHANLSSNALALLPNVRKGNQALELGIIAITSKGKIAESIYTTLPLSSVTEDQWLRAYDSALRNLYAKLPWPGTVAAVKNRELDIAIKGEFIDKSDRISVETPHGPMSASIKKISPKGARISLDAASHLTAEDLSKLIGNKVQKIVHGASSIEDNLTNELGTLVSIKSEHKGRRLARKYLAESNPDEAIKILTASLDESTSSLSDLEFIITIENQRGKSDGILQALQKMAALATKLGKTDLLPLIETNIQLVQVENLPAIQGDRNIANRFAEIEQNANGLKSRLPNTFTSSQQAIALSYIILTAQQKAAESNDDLLKLAAMSDAWSDFEKNLGPTEDLPQQAWRTCAGRQKDRTSMGSQDDNRSL